MPIIFSPYYIVLYINVAYVQVAEEKACLLRRFYEFVIGEHRVNESQTNVTHGLHLKGTKSI